MNIETIYIKYGPMVLRRCRYFLSSEEFALEAMQDTFIKVIENMERFKEVINPGAFLHKIATNVCLNKLRYNKMNRETITDPSILEVLVGEVPSSEKSVLAKNLLKKIFGKNIDELTLSVAAYHYVDGLTLEETAKFLGVSVSTVRYRLRNLQKISNKFKGSLDE